MTISKQDSIYLLIIAVIMHFNFIFKKKPVLLLLILAFPFHHLFSQNSTVSSGGDFSSDTGSVSFSMGQPFFFSYSNSDYSISEGLQQPLEVSVLSIDEALFSGLISVYPIPTSNYITLKISDFDIDQLTYEVIDLRGKVLMTNKINTNETKIDLYKLEQSIYLLNIKKQGKLIRTTKILKF